MKESVSVPLDSITGGPRRVLRFELDTDEDFCTVYIDDETIGGAGWSDGLRQMFIRTLAIWGPGDDD